MIPLDQLAPGGWLTLASAAGGHGGALGSAMADFILQLAIVLIAARLGGMFFRKVLRLPEVLGELSAGMAIGPHALGNLAWPLLGPVFPLLPGELISVSPALYGMATFASVLLLFVAGLETNLALFLRYSFAGILVGLGGAIFSFGLGAACAVWFGVSEHLFDPSALFLGVISTATSVGITARILAERRKTETPEGVTIMAAAVLDDVLGIVLLAIVVGIAQIDGHAGDGGIPWGDISLVAGKAFGFWLVCTLVGILIAKRISRVLKVARSPASITALSLGLALLLAALSERSGLALIIGAYIMGLSLSTTDLAQFLQDQLRAVYDLVVPVFFCVMGMLVDFSTMPEVLALGLVYTLLATLSKVFGCALPALLAGFTLRGGFRIGFGMLPRGEVALIIAGMGLSLGVIPPPMFGVAIMMTVLTTLVAPPLLIRSFRGGSGVRGQSGAPAETEVVLTLPFPSEDVAEFVASRLLQAFRREEFFVHTLHGQHRSYQMRKDDMAISMHQEGAVIDVRANTTSEAVARFIVLEELLSMEDVFESCRQLKNMHEMGNQLLAGLFEPPPPAPPDAPPDTP
jgi:Kef-type K+ transport system membrane component KefB